MELSTIKLAKKLSPYTRVIVIAKENGFIAKNSNEYVGGNISLEKISFRSSLSLSIILKTRDIIKKYNIKNVIFFGASELKSLYFSFLYFDINLIIRHGTTKTKSKKNGFRRLIYNRVNYHVSTSKHIFNNVQKIIPFGKATKECIIYPSIKYSPSQNSNDSNDIRLLHTGRITEGKGQLDAIKACKTLVENDIYFYFNIVGGYENEKDKDIFLDFYKTVSYKNSINITGHVDNVIDFIEHSNIFIFPSYGEGFGNSFVEALSAGLVCICYENTTFKEFKKLGFYMHIVEDRSINKLQEKLLYVAQNIAYEKEKSKKNIDLVKTLFNEEKETKKYLDILQ
ncbi:MAG: glycosyltransferase [Methyloprofundus sp.]|nr:glycosyltransferase [Methyloprofundus sp.]